MLPALRPMRPLRTGPTPFFAVSPIWWQALHTLKTFSPAAASWALTSPAPATANSATKTTARIMFSCSVEPLSGSGNPCLVEGKRSVRHFQAAGRRHHSSTTYDQSSACFDDASLQVRSGSHDVPDSRHRHQAERGGKRVRFGGRWRNDAHRAVERWAASCRGIEQMREPAFGVEPESGASRRRDRAIDKINGFGDDAGPVRIGKPYAPRRAIQPCPDRAYLAHVDQRGRQARAAQILDDVVRGISLRDAVQRHRCAATGHRYPVLA